LLPQQCLLSLIDLGYQQLPSIQAEVVEYENLLPPDSSEQAANNIASALLPATSVDGKAINFWYASSFYGNSCTENYTMF